MTLQERQIAEDCRACGGDPHRLLDVLGIIARRDGRVSTEAARNVAQLLRLRVSDVVETSHFYDHLRAYPKGCMFVRVSDDAASRLHDSHAVLAALRSELGVQASGVSADGRFYVTAGHDAGMADQSPAVVIDGLLLPQVSVQQAKDIGRRLKHGEAPANFIGALGDGVNAHPLVHSPVHNHIRQVGPVLFRPMARGEALRKATRMTPVEVIRAVKTARLRGRGMDSLPTGVKWGFVRTACAQRVESLWGEEAAAGRDYSREFDRISTCDERYVVCIACDGEPGSFRDRVLLTECAERLIAGMTIAGYAVGAHLGILYIRQEYAYLTPYLSALLAQRVQDNLLGQTICGKHGFDFNIQLRVGSHPFVMGEETGVIAACEGRAAVVRARPPYPTSCGYLGHPTATNCAETLCCITKIIDEGPGSLCDCGTAQSTGSKLLTVSGDCRRPGAYEVPFGISIRSVLELAGAEHAEFALISGTSPRLMRATDFSGRIGYEHVSTTGAVMCVSGVRDPLRVAADYLQSIAGEQCGACAPCRGGLPLAASLLDQIALGDGRPDDLEQLSRLASMLQAASLCVVGRLAGHFICHLLQDFAGELEDRVCTPVVSANVHADPDRKARRATRKSGG